MRKQKKHLVQQLREFGLNPSFWSLQRLKGKDNWLVVHKSSKKLLLRGISLKEKKWQDLQWLI